MIIKDMCEAASKEKILRDWVIQKQKSVYVYIEDSWRNCDFKYDWFKSSGEKSK
jgi:peptidyl-prolyl cis-trans isomerase SurA